MYKGGRRLNRAPVTRSTTYQDDSPAAPGTYSVRAVVNGHELKQSSAALDFAKGYAEIPLAAADGYTVQHAWPGDLDGDGRYELVVSRLARTRDKPDLLEAYTLTGARLWRVDIGPGSYTQVGGNGADDPAPAAISGSTAIGGYRNGDNVTVYDLDGDGEAEVLVDTADGTTFAEGAKVTADSPANQVISVIDGETAYLHARPEPRPPPRLDRARLSPVDVHGLLPGHRDPAGAEARHHHRRSHGRNLMTTRRAFATLAAGAALSTLVPATTASASPRHRRGRLIAHDGFRHGLGQWVTELQDGGTVSASRGVLEIDVPSGATVWFKQRLEGPYVIEYTATPVSEGGVNDRVSDLNNFWNAVDVRSPNDLFATPRGGALAEYDYLKTYYVGYGANTNTTTRLRRYVGEPGVRPLVYDYTEAAAHGQRAQPCPDRLGRLHGPLVGQRTAGLRLRRPGAVHERALRVPDHMEPLPDRGLPGVAAVQPLLRGPYSGFTDTLRVAYLTTRQPLPTVA